MNSMICTGSRLASTEAQSCSSATSAAVNTCAGTKVKSVVSDEVSQGVCRPPVASSTATRTCLNICSIGSPGSGSILASAAVNGLLPVGAVQRHRLRRGGVGQKGAGRRLHLGQTVVAHVRNRLERVVAAGVEDDDVGLVLGREHLPQHRLRLDRRPDPDRRHWSAGHRPAAGSSSRSSARRGRHSRTARSHRGRRRAAPGRRRKCPARISASGASASSVTLKPIPRQRRGDQLGVALGIVEPADMAVGAVADHQRDPRLGVGGPCRQQGHRQHQNRQQPAKPLQAVDGTEECDHFDEQSLSMCLDVPIRPKDGLIFSQPVATFLGSQTSPEVPG